MAEFKIGDIVALKSGGPLMTVDSVPSGEIQHINCVWFDDVTVKRWTFNAEALKRGDLD